MRLPAIIFVVVCVAGCQTIQMDRPHAIDEHAWTTDGGSPLRERSRDVRVDAPLEIAWQYNAAAGFGPGSVLIVRDRLYVGNRKGELHAIDIETGKRAGYRVFNESIEATPLLAHGTLYITSPWGNKALLAYDPERSSVKWRVSGIPVEVSAVATPGLVIIVDVQGVVRAYRSADGTEAWTYRTGERQSVQSTPVMLPNDRLFVATDSGLLVCLNADTGEHIWRLDTGYPVYASAASDGKILFVPTTRGKLLAIDVDAGRVLWEFDTGFDHVRLSAPSVRDGSVVFGGTDGIVRRLDGASGRQQWTANVGDVVAAPPQWTDTALYVGTMGRTLSALDPDTGTRLWQHVLEGRIKSAMATSDGALYVLVEPRYVVKFVSRMEEHPEND